MKKLITILFILISVFGYSQRAVQGDTLRIRKGGTFGGNVVLDTNQLKQLTYATDSLDAVPLGQMQDSLTSVSAVLSKVDATNISNVRFINDGGDTLLTTFGHLHTEYALQTQLTDVYDSILWRSNTDSAYLKTAKDIGMQEKNIYNADSIHANWYGGSDIVIGETGSKATINMDSVTLSRENGINDGSDALVTSNEVYDLFYGATSTGIQVADSSLTSGEFDLLGASYTLLPALSGLNFYKIWGISVYYNVTSTVEVGTQNLNFYHSSGGTMGSFSNTELEGTGGYFHIFIESAKTEAEMQSDGLFLMQLSGSANPSSGTATIRVKVYYSIEKF